MAEEVKKGGFDFYLRFVKPLVINLPDPTDRVLAAAWVQKLRNNKSGNEELRTNYIKLLLFVLQRKRLIGPFRENPNTVKDLEEIPANMQILDIAKFLLQADEVERRERLRLLIAGGGDDFPPYNIECSADLLEYAAAQDIPKFGVQAYYAISNSPITTWENVDISYLPKGVSLDKGVSGGNQIGATASTPDVLNKSQLSVSDSKSKSRSRSPKQEKGSPKGGDKSPGKSPKRTHTKASPGKSPLGSKAPTEDRSPPTWGSNLIEVTDPPDDTAFKNSLASGVDFADVNKLLAEELKLQGLFSHIKKSDADVMPEVEPDYFQTPTDKFVDQFKSISIRAGTGKAQDIIDEVNQSLLESGMELSLSQAQAEVDKRFPHRRKDMPTTPPIFSKHQTIREAGRGIQYSPQQFGITDEDKFVFGPPFIDNLEYSPKQAVNTRADLRQKRMISEAFSDIEGDVNLEEHTPDMLMDDFADEVEEAIRSPKNVKKKLRELLNEIEIMKETTPALGGVPVTTPKRSPSPSRKFPSPDFDLEDQFALFTEKFPDLIEAEYMDLSADESPEKKSPHISPLQPGSPIRGKADQILSSPKTPSPRQGPESPRSRAARLRPESPPTPVKPDYDELMSKTLSARKFLRPRKFEIMPKSTGKKIKVYSKPVKHYKPPSGLNKIEESPEYKTTIEDRYYDLYEKLVADDIPTSPPASSKLPVAIHLSPLSPQLSPNLDWIQDYPDESDDFFDYPDLYESPKIISPLKELDIPEQTIEGGPDVMEDIQFNFDYEPLDLGATEDMQDLYEGDLYEPISPRTPPHLTQEEIANLLGTPQESPERPRTPVAPPRPQPSPIPSPQFYEMENVLTPQEFDEVMKAHQYTDTYVSRDPRRRLTSDLRTPSGSRRIPLTRYAPKPRLATIADKPVLEEIVTQREREHPPTPPSPLTPGVPWRRPQVQGMRIDHFPEEIQEKIMEPVQQRELKDWEKFVFETVIKPEDKDYFMRLFNEYDIIKEDLINPDIIEHRSLREPRLRVPISELLKSPPPPPVADIQFEGPKTKPRVNMRVVTPPEVVMGPDDIPPSWALTKSILEQAEMDKEYWDQRESRQAVGGFFADDYDDLFATEMPLIDDAEFTFESPKSRATRMRPESPPTPVKPTYEELIANAKAAKKKRRPSKMMLGTPGGTVKKYYTRPLRHYEPLSYLDRIDESPYVSPDWAKISESAAQMIAEKPNILETTPQLHTPQKRFRGQSRIREPGTIKPRKLKFTSKVEAATPKYFQDDSALPAEDRAHFNKLLATLPGLPPEALPEDLMGQYYEHEFPNANYIIDKNIPAKHLQYQGRPLSPKREDIFFPKSPVTPPLSPIRLQNMFADPLNQEMIMDFPEDIEGDIEPIPDPYAFMANLPTKFAGFEEDLIPEFIGTEHEGFMDSPDRPTQQLKRPGTPTTPVGLVSPGSPIGLDTFYQTPPAPELFDRYDEDSHELWMEYQPIEYFEVGQFKMDTPPKPKALPSPKLAPKPKTPRQSPRAPSPKPESPFPEALTLEEMEQMYKYTTSPSPFMKSPYYRTPPPPKHKYGLTPTRPSPYKETYTPPELPPAYAAIEASPIQFADPEPFLYLASPEYANEILDSGELEDFDFSFASLASSPDQEDFPTHLTATPSPRHQTPVKDSPHRITTTPQVSPQLSGSPFPSPISQHDANWDLEMMGLEGDLLDVTPENLDVTPIDMYDSPVCSPTRPCRDTPPTPPQPWAYEDQFASPTAEEFQQMMAEHEFNERHVSRDPHRKLATKVLRTTTGNRAFRLRRHAPKPILPTVYDFDETPEHMEVIEAQVPEIPPDLIWKSPEPVRTPPIVVPKRYDTHGYTFSPEQNFQSDFIKMLPKRKEVRRNLFDEFVEDSEIQEGGVQDFTPPSLSDEAWFQSPESPVTPPQAFSPSMEQRMQRSIYDGSAPYADYPEVVTPPSGTRRRMRTYTPPGPAVRSPIKPTHEEMMQNIADSYASATPYTMGIHSRTGFIKEVQTRPAADFHSKRMKQIDEVGEEYLTPPSGLRRHRRTYTPQATPRASPRLAPEAIKSVGYTPSPIPSPHIWFEPTYTPPPHLRWSPLPMTPSPPKYATPPGTTKTPARRQLFSDSAESPMYQTPRAPHRGRQPSPSPDLPFLTPANRIPPSAGTSSDDLDVFATPELSPSRGFMFEQEIIYNVVNAFADAQTEPILDTSDIQMVEDDEDMDFKWMG